MSSIDRDTGLPIGVKNQTPLLEQIAAVAEGIELAISGEISVDLIKKTLLMPDNAKLLMKEGVVYLNMKNIEGFDFNAFVEKRLPISTIEKRRELGETIQKHLGTWALSQGLNFEFRDLKYFQEPSLIFSLKTEKANKETV